MEHREHLEHRKKDRGTVVGANGSNGAIGTRSHTHTMHSPLWGECRLTPQSDEPVQKFAIGYVAFEGDPDNLKLAMWRDGDWRDRQLRPLKGKVATWYKVTTRDGSAILS